MTTFRNLRIGQSFDFIGPNRSNSFFLRCVKISTRKYRDEDGVEHRIGTINCEVFHTSHWLMSDNLVTKMLRNRLKT